jgi:hypothetical protein
MRARTGRSRPVRAEQIESFTTTVLADWLDAHAATQVAMEATGVVEARLGGPGGSL